MPDLVEHVADGVAVLTMNRPAAMNALSQEMLDRLAEATERLGF